MGRYIYRFHGAGDLDPALYKYEVGEQDSELGEVIRKLTGLDPFTNEGGELVWIDRDMLPRIRPLLDELKGDPTPAASYRAAMLRVVMEDVEQHGDGYFLSDY